MFKRATWLGVGFTLGVGTTVVAARKARQQLDRYKPPAVVDRVTTTITDKAAALRGHLTEAVADGREAARTREAELRSTHAAGVEGADGDDDELRPPTEIRLEEPRRRRRRAGARSEEGRTASAASGTSIPEA
jgi:hypothetical protein